VTTVDCPATLEENAAAADAEEAIDSATDDVDDGAIVRSPTRKAKWARVIVFGVLPAIALLLAMTAGYLKWQDNTTRDNRTAGIESAQAAKESTAALLSYQPNTVEQQLGAARNLVTGDFANAYAQLTHDVVVPGAKKKQISATVTVPAAAAVSASENHAVALVFVNQTTVIGTDPPTASASAVRVTLDKVNGRWLISQFDPV